MNASLIYDGTLVAKMSLRRIFIRGMNEKY